MSTESTPIVISTGNILTVNKKAGQKPVEELLDCLRTTFATQQQKGPVQVVEEGGERSQVKVGAKIFVNIPSTDNLRSALNELYKVLNVDHLDNLILAFHPRVTANGVQTNGDAKPATNGQATENGSSEAVLEWANGHANAQSDLIALWQVLEEYAKAGKIRQLGIADLDVTALREVFEKATTRPAIAQINLQACCVVPPSLQEFCTQNDIQMLTHSDPEEIINQTMLEEVSGNTQPMEPVWTVRYQVHLKCRGVLTVKGYLVGAK